MMAQKERNESLSPINSIVIIQPTLKQTLLSSALQTNEKESSYRICIDTTLANAVSIQSRGNKTNLYSYKISKSIFDPELSSFYWHHVRPFVESTLIGYHGMIIFLQSSHIYIQKVTPFELLFKSIDQILKCIYRSKYKHTQYFQVLFSHFALSIEGGHLFDLCRGLDPASYLYRENNGRQHKLIKTRLIDLDHLKNLIDRNHRQFVSELCHSTGASENLAVLGYHEFICVNVGFLGFSASFAPIGGELTFVILSTDYLKDSRLDSSTTLDVQSTTNLTRNTFIPLLRFLDKVISVAIDIDTDNEDSLCALLSDGVGGACKTCFISSVPDKFGINEFESEVNNEQMRILEIAHQSSLVVNCPNRKVFAEKALMNIYLHEINASTATDDSQNDSEAANKGGDVENSDITEVSEDTIQQAAVALEQAVMAYTDGLETAEFECEMDIPDINAHKTSRDHSDIVEITPDNTRNFTPMNTTIRINVENTILNKPLESKPQVPLVKRKVILDDSPDEVRKTASSIPEWSEETGVPAQITPPVIMVAGNQISSEIVTTAPISENSRNKVPKQEPSDQDVVMFTPPPQQQNFDLEPFETSQGNINIGIVSRKLPENQDVLDEFLYEEMLNLGKSKSKRNPMSENCIDNNPPTHHTNIYLKTKTDESKNNIEIGSETAEIERIDSPTIQIKVESAEIQSNGIPLVSVVTDNENAGALPSIASEIQWDPTELPNSREEFIASPSSDIPVDFDTEEGKRMKMKMEERNPSRLEFGNEQNEFLINNSELERKITRVSQLPNCPRNPPTNIHIHLHTNMLVNSDTKTQPIVHTTSQTKNDLPVTNSSDINRSVVQTERKSVNTTESSNDVITQLGKTNTQSYPIPAAENSYEIESPGHFQTDPKDDENLVTSINFTNSTLPHDNTEQVEMLYSEDSRDSKHMRNTMQLPFLSKDGERVAKRLEVTSPLLEQMNENQGDAQIAEVVTFMLQDPVRGAPRSHQARGSKEVLQRRDLGGVFTGHSITSWILNNVYGIRDWGEAEMFGQWLLDQDALIHSEGSFVFAGAESLFYYARRSQPCTGLIGSEEIKRLMSEARKVLSTATTEFYDDSHKMEMNETFNALGIEGASANDEMVYHQLMAEQVVVMNESSNNEENLNAYFASTKLNQSQANNSVASNKLENSVSSDGKGNVKKFLWNSEVKSEKIHTSLNDSQASISEMFHTRDIDVRKAASDLGFVDDQVGNEEVINVIERRETVLVGNITEKYVEITSQDYELHPLFANCREGCRAGVLRNLVMSFGVNFEDEMKRTGLFYAAASDQGRVGQELIKYHANVNHVDKFNTSPLLVAVELGHYSFMSMLLSHHSDVTIYDKSGTNAYHLACKLESPGCIQKLLHKAKPGVLDRIDKRGFTPLHYAIRNQFSTHVEMLVKHRPTLSILDSNGLNYLSFAIYTHSFSCITPLIKAFPQLSGQTNADLSTALHVAAIQSTPEYLALLLNTRSCRKHYNIHNCDSRGRSPLHAACKKGVDDNVKLLIRHNAAVISVDNNGLSSLQYAKANEKLSQDIIDLLEATEVDEVRGIMKLQDGGSKTCEIQ